MVIITHTSKNETIADAVERIYRDIIKFGSLKPSPQVNQHFEELVDLSLKEEGNIESTIQQLKQRGVDIKNLWRR